MLWPISRLRSAGFGPIAIALAVLATPQPVSAQDLFIRDTPADTGTVRSPGPAMWVSEDIWVRRNPDPAYSPQPFPAASATPPAHQDPIFRDPLSSRPNYIYIRIHNDGPQPSRGTEKLHVYWAKASTGLGWPAQWNDYFHTAPGVRVFAGAEVTKPRRNAAHVTATERTAYKDAVVAIATDPAHRFSDMVSYWLKQQSIHGTAVSSMYGHHTPGFLPWHRELLNRYENLLQEADPTVKLLYWNWTGDPLAAPSPTGPVNLFTPAFMGLLNRGAGTAQPIGPPFNALGGPTIVRHGQNGAPPMGPDATVMANTSFSDPPGASRGAWNTIELAPNHDPAHRYIGGQGGTIRPPATSASDPFFFLLHGNVDRLWAQWQRGGAAARRVPATAYGTDQMSAAITQDVAPWDGPATISPWTPDAGAPPTTPSDTRKTAIAPSIVSPPAYDLAPITIPVVGPNQTIVMQIPWYPPRPADFAGGFPGDQGHFCLLARIEADAPFGMQTPEVTNVETNTRLNNNIAWKNVTVVEPGPGAMAMMMIMRNVFEEPVAANLVFAPGEGSEERLRDAGRFSVDLGPELFRRWEKAGGKAEGIERAGKTELMLTDGKAGIFGIELMPGEGFPVTVGFEVAEKFQPTLERGPALDVIQTGSPKAAGEIVGGVRYELDLSELVLVKAGADWRYSAGGADAPEGWEAPDFDDSGWATGAADFGFGGEQATTVYAGPSELRRTAGWFRHAFEVSDPGRLGALHLRLRRDDGAVVYLNGKEVFRSNVPEGFSSADVLASRDVTGPEAQAYFPAAIDAGLLREGRNVVAVRTHLHSPEATEMGFDLELVASPADPGAEPEVAFTRPVYGALLKAGRPHAVQAEAFDPDGRIVKVAFFAGEDLIGTAVEAPYVFEWAEDRPDAYDLRLVAEDDQGRSATAYTTVSIVENVPPVVELVAPSGPVTLQPGESLQARAEAFDEDGKIARVDFFLLPMSRFGPGNRVASVTEPPFAVTLDKIPAGAQMLYAVAVDDGGIAIQSAAVHVHVGH